MMKSHSYVVVNNLLSSLNNNQVISWCIRLIKIKVIELFLLSYHWLIPNLGFSSDKFYLLTSKLSLIIPHSRIEVTG